MNALDRKIMNAAKTSQGALLKGALVVGAAAAAALLAGCANPIASVKVDPNSPIAPEVAKLASSDHDYPSFNEIPPKPTDLLPPKIYGERARAVVAARDRLVAATAPNTWTLNSTAAFQAGAQAAAGPNYTPAPADTEAFANSVRKRATPPPPANR